MNPSINRAHHRLSVLLALAAGAALSAAPVAEAQPGATVEAPLVKEKNPPGDISDSQVFVTYKSPLGFTLKVPEGWGRTDAQEGVSFADKYGRITVELSTNTGPLTVASVRAKEAAALEKNGRAVKISNITEAKLPSGAAVKISYASNSEPNSVTNKQIRLESDRYLIIHNDKAVSLTFSAPAGADNVDQWTLMSKSFGWQ